MMVSEMGMTKQLQWLLYKFMMLLITNFSVERRLFA